MNVAEIQPRGDPKLTTQTPEAATKRSFLLTGEGWPYLLVPLIPVAILLGAASIADPVPILPRPRLVSSRLPHSWAAPPRSLRLAQVRASADC